MACRSPRRRRTGQPSSSGAPQRRGARFLLLRRAQVAADPGAREWLWGPPAGARLPGEDIAACALREGAGLEGPVSPGPHGTPDWFVYTLRLPGPAPIPLSEEHDRFL